MHPARPQGTRADTLTLALPPALFAASVPEKVQRTLVTVVS